jgi:hypothetical protein
MSELPLSYVVADNTIIRQVERIEVVQVVHAVRHPTRDPGKVNSAL